MLTRPIYLAMTRTIEELHVTIKDQVKKVKQSEAELVSLLMEMDKLKGYFHFGYSSLCEYAVRALNLSESQAKAYSAVARRAVFIPELYETLKNEELSVSKAKRITS